MHENVWTVTPCHPKPRAVQLKNRSHKIKVHQGCKDLTAVEVAVLYPEEL
jgi:hypothetical protein